VGTPEVKAVRYISLDKASARLEGGRRLRSPASQNATRPRITVLTVVFNGGEHLIPTIESVLALKRNDVEYIVVDGGSTDNTMEVLRRYDDRLDFWLSERDTGIYDAMNKGIALAHGTFIHHLNIGDQLLAIPTLLSGEVPSDIVCVAGQVRIGLNQVHIPSTGLGLKLHNTLHHQGCFYRVGPQLHYDLRYRVFSDFDLNQRMVNAGHRVLTCSDLVAVHDGGGVSHTTHRFNEIFRIIRKNEGMVWVVLSFLYFKLRGLRSRLTGS
jgi:glycosyltransferase involved in cell wall biosynthesis